MPRDERAYLTDILDACEAIGQAVADLGLEQYLGNRLVRSAVEREFITIGEALRALWKASPDTFARISHSRRIVDFRNQLTHEYATVDDTLVWAIARNDAPVLLQECRTLLEK
jgi:uncharacterized protein with HEPN domain